MREINLTKQKIIIIGFILIFAIAMVMITVMFFSKKNKQSRDIEQKQEQKKENNGTNTNKQNETIKQSNISSSKIMKLADGPVAGLVIAKDTNRIMFYQNQKFLTADPYDGKKQSFGGYPFKNIQTILWNKELDLAIVNDNGEYYIYNTTNNVSNKFRDKIDNAIWSKTGDRVIYKYYNPKTHKRKIRIANIDGANSEVVVENIPYRRIEMNLQPMSNNICYYPQPDARVIGKLFCFDINHSTKKDYNGHYGADYLWSPNGERILTSFTKEDSGNQLVLSVMNKDGGEVRGLGFATSVKKCVWSKDNVNVYCAMIGGSPTDIMLPNAWREGIFNSVDTFWKINTTTGKKTRLINLDEITSVIDSSDLVLDAEEEFLFFRNRRDGSLWRLKLN